MHRLLILCLFASSAHAHGGQLAAEGLFYQNDELVAISANFGLLSKTSDGFEWACFDNLTSVPFEGFYHGDSWYAKTRAGLFESSDKGCSWTAVGDSLAGQPVHGLRRDGEALVVRAQRLPAVGQLHRDEGQGFATWGAPLPEGEFLDFMVRSSDRSVFALVQDDGEDPRLWVTDSNMATWTLVATLEGLSYPEFIDLRLGEGQLVFAAFRVAAGELWAVSSGNELRRRAQLPTPVQEGRTHEGEHWVITLTGVPLKAIGNGPFLPAEGPEHCTAYKGDRMVACGDIDDRHLVLERVEGGFTPRYPFESLQGPACADNECNARWAQLQSTWLPPNDAGPAVDAGQPVEPPGGCGCVTAAPDELLWLLALVFGRRRRRCSMV